MPEQRRLRQLAQRFVRENPASLLVANTLADWFATLRQCLLGHYDRHKRPDQDG
jgi:hypothetical protein